jgi:serine/threonine-protein kinase
VPPHSGSGVPSLRALLDEALDLAAPERETLILRLRATNPEHAGTLERLLAAEAELDTSRFLLTRSWNHEDRGVPGLAGQRLGSYTLERPLGQGGMGTVWLGRRSDGRFEGSAAIKLLNLALLEPIGAERFRREGSVLARVSHPNIARLLDAGLTEAGQPYLVLEHVEGERVDRYCDERRLPPERRLRLFLDVAAAVAHAHSNLVVHRDLKPSNILVTSGGMVKLLDFGIAKLLDAESGAESSSLTDLGGRALTPEYAAPEQVAGGAVTTATDVYALGVLLYVLLSGRHPTGEGSQSAGEHLRAVVDTEPQRMSAVVTGAEARGTSPDRLRRLYAGDLDNIVAKALKKRPEERYPGVGALAADVERYLNHQPVSARADSWRYRTAKFLRRNRLAVGLGLLAIVALLGGLAGTVSQAVRATVYAARADSAAGVAEQQRDFALGQLSRAEAVNELNAFVLNDAAPAGKPFTVGDLLARAESILAREQPGADPNRVDMLVAIGRMYSTSEREGTGRRLLRQAYDLSRTVREPSVRAKAACALASALGRSGESERGERLFAQGLSELPEGSQYGLDRIFCLLRGSAVARESGRGRDGVERADSARRLLTTLRSPPPALRVHILIDLADAYRIAGQPVAADTIAAAAYAELKALGRENTQTAGTLLNNWGLAVLQGVGDPRRAERLFREAVRISSTDPDGDAVSPMLRTNLARALATLGRNREAIQQAERAYVRGVRDGDDIVTNQSLLLRIDLHRDVGDLDVAERLLGEVEPRLRKALPARHYVFALLLMHRAQLSQARGKIDGALSLAGRAVALGDTIGVSGDVMSNLLRRRADIVVKAGRGAAAVRDATRALELTRAHTRAGAPSFVLGLNYLLLARALHIEREWAEAGAALDSARVHLVPTVGDDHPRTREANALARSIPLPATE